MVEQQADVDKQAIIEFESLMRQESDAVPKVRDEPIEAEGAPKSKDTEETAKLAVLQSVANKTISKSKKVGERPVAAQLSTIVTRQSASCDCSHL